MRQQDYKMVQGGNTRVNMNAGAATQAGNALAKLGQTLAQTGQDVSKIMEVTVDAQEKTDLIRAKQKWKEIQAKQSIFEEKNKRDPLLWDENRQKLMKEFESYNGEIKTYTKNGSLNLQLNKESWASDFKYNTLQGMQKRINMNLAGETLASVQDSIDNNDPIGAQRALDDGRSALTPEAEAQALRSINKAHDRLIYNDSIDMIDADPKGEYSKVENSEGHYAHYKNDRDTREKLLAETRNRMSLKAREQADNLTAIVNSSPKFTSKDLDNLIEDGALSQYSDGNLAKLRASVERDEPATQAEIMGAYKLIIDLEKRRPNMTTMEYVEEYNNLEATVLSVMPAKGKGWVRQYLYSINPSSKDAGSSVEKSKTRAKKEATKVLVALQDMGGFLPSYTAPIEMGSLLPEFEVQPPLDTGEFKDETLKVQEQSRQKMADVEAELFDFIENYEGELTNEIIRTKAGEVMGTQKVNKALERIKPPSKQPAITNLNKYGIQQSPNELDMEEVRGYNDLPQRQSDASGSLLPQGKRDVNEFVQQMTQEEIDELKKILNQQ
jgi:hypothetical protein